MLTQRVCLLTPFCVTVSVIHIFKYSCITIPLFLKSGQGRKIPREVLAHPIAIRKLLNFWCCDLYHFYSLYVQTINVYWAPRRVDIMSAFVCICSWVSVCLTVWPVASMSKALWRLHALHQHKGGYRIIFFLLLYFFFNIIIDLWSTQ